MSDEPIHLKGQRPLATRNLFGAVKRLRFPNQDRVLWIDALCINQKDAAERSHQVALMAKVYRQAKDVIAWLEEPPVESADEVGWDLDAISALMNPLPRPGDSTWS